MNGKKILIYNNYFSAGGVEVFMKSVIEYLVKKGCDVTVAAMPVKEADFQHPFGPQVKSVHRKLLKNIYKKHTLFWFLDHITYRLRENLIYLYLNRKHFDVVIAAQEKWIMHNAAKIRGKRNYAWVHTDYSTRLRLFDPSFSNADEELACMRLFDHVVCVSETARKGLVNSIGDPGNLCVLYNPIDVKSIRQAALLPCALTRPEGKPLIISVGRLDPEKQYLMLLDACRLLREKMDFELWIVGEGTQRGQLEEYIARENMSYVKLLGKQSNPFHYIAQADLFVSSSVTEGYGLAIQEALVLGIPVAAVRCPAIYEAVDLRFGAVSDNSADSLKEVLSNLLQDPSVLQRIRDDIAQHYKTESLYEDRLEAIWRLLDKNEV